MSSVQPDTNTKLLPITNGTGQPRQAAGAVPGTLALAGLADGGVLTVAVRGLAAGAKARIAIEDTAAGDFTDALPVVVHHFDSQDTELRISDKLAPSTLRGSKLRANVLILDDGATATVEAFYQTTALPPAPPQ